MKTIPMIFNTDMIKALLDGSKTVTRRPVAKNLIEHIKFMGSSDDSCENLEFLGLTYENWTDDKNKKQGPEYLVYCTEYPEEGVIPIGQGPARKGDLIYVRETWREFNNSNECGCSDHCLCPKTGTPLYLASHDDGESKWKPSIHMPRWASRLTLKVTGVRIERVQDITPQQALLEGIKHQSMNCPIAEFGQLWNSIYNDWYENPYVWVIEFEVIHQNIDTYLKNDAN